MGARAFYLFMHLVPGLLLYPCLDFRLFELRHEIDAFGDELSAWLDSPKGRFAQWLAERSR